MALPTTTEAFELNVMRAHFQACTWKNTAESSPPSLDPVKYGWIKDEMNKTLPLVMLPNKVSPAPVLVPVKHEVRIRIFQLAGDV